MHDLKCPKIVKIMDFWILRMPDLKSPKIVEIMDFRNFRRSLKPSGPGYPTKHQKRDNMSQKGTSRTTSECFFIKYTPKRERRPKAAALFWERPKAAPIFDEKASKSGHGCTCLTKFDSFLCFLVYPGPDSFHVVPEIPQINHFDIFSTLSIVHRKCSRKHIFDHFLFSRSGTRSGQCNPSI